MESYYPDEEVSVENILQYRFSGRYQSLEALYTAYGYSSLDEYLIAYKMVERELYPNKNIVITFPNGSKSTVSLLYPTTSFSVYLNGTYIVTATCEEQTKEESIKIANIIDKDIYELAQEDENTYAISYIEDLVGLSSNVNNCIDNYKGKTIKILNNLDFNSDSSYKNPNDKSFGDINNNGIVESIKTELTTEEGFIPIGIGNQYDTASQVSFLKYFYGTFDGNGNTIANLYINNIRDLNTSSSCEYIGLFGYISGATIQNLTVSGNINLTNIEEGIRKTLVVGGIAGYTFSSTIQGCNNYVNINIENDSYNYIGGITGEGICTNVDQCNNYGKISGSYIGDPEEDSEGYVYETSAYQGGILGVSSIYTSVSNCNNYENVALKSMYITINLFEGGIAGTNESSSTITNCGNYADIEIADNGGIASNRPYVGGICGYNCSIIQKCSNQANISNSSIGVYVYVAGISGMCNQGTIEESYNIGTITNTGKVTEAYINTGLCSAAGIVASNSGTSSVGSIINNSYNLGNIVNNGTNKYIGGITSYNNSASSVSNSYNIGNIEIENPRYAGSIVGLFSGNISNCYYLEGTYTQGTGSGEVGTIVKTAAEMKTEDFVQLLQGTQTDIIWKIVDGQNDGYPVLSWQE